jgi:hypothetical protein
VEDAVEADVAESQFVFCGLELGQAVVADQGAGKVGTDREVGEAVARYRRRIEVDRNAAGGVIGG